MNIDYILESTSLCGGVKVVFEQAEALQECGLRARVISYTSAPTWLNPSTPFLQTPQLSSEIFVHTDYIVGTGAFHINRLAQDPTTKRKLIHLIQGYEPDYAEASPFLTELAACYRLNIPKWTVSERLRRYIRKIYPQTKSIHNIGQAIHHEIFFPSQARDGSFTILVMGSANNSSKGIESALRIVAAVRQMNPAIRLIRITAEDCYEKERHITPIDRYHIALTPPQVACEMRAANYFLSTSTDAEGFGLPLLEAMACGMVCAANPIPSYLAFDAGRDFCHFFTAETTQGKARELLRLHQNNTLRTSLAKRAIEVAARYKFREVAKRIIHLLTNVHPNATSRYPELSLRAHRHPGD